MGEINKLSLTLDEDALYNSLIYRMITAINRCASELMGYMRIQASHKIESDWVIQDTLYYAMRGEIIAIVGNNHWYAFIDNYGSGSKLDMMDNPWFMDYWSSEYFNEDRESDDWSVVARPKGEYESIDWESGHGFITKEGSGRKEDDGTPLNLENIDGNGQYNPINSKNWLRAGMTFIQKRMHDIILQSLESFDVSQFLKGGD